jgi:hypothetical protein
MANYREIELDLGKDNTDRIMPYLRQEVIIAERKDHVLRHLHGKLHRGPLPSHKDGEYFIVHASSQREYPHGVMHVFESTGILSTKNIEHFLVKE